MIKLGAVLLTALFFAPCAHAATELALAFPRGAAPTCPAGSPSPDGSVINPVGTGQTSCTLTDYQSNTWQFQGATLYSNGNPVSSYAQFEIASSGRAFAKTTCARGNYTVWLQNSSNGLIAPVPSPTQANTQNPFWDTTKSASYVSFYGMMNSGQISAGDSLEIKPLNAGGVPPIWFGAGRVTLSNLTYTIDAGSVVGCTVDEGNAVFPVDTGGGAVSGVTINGAGNTSEIAYAIDTNSGQYRGVNWGRGTDWTLSNVYIHDNDFGVQGVAYSGGVGKSYMTNVTLDHNGSSAPGQASPTHNVYLNLANSTGTETSQIIVSNMNSYCTNGTVAAGTDGFQFKSRWPAGTITGSTFAEPSQHGYTDCYESAAVDISCGGAYTLGDGTAGHGDVFEVGPNLDSGANNNGVIRFAAEVQYTTNCPTSGTGWGTNTLTINGCWIINDSSLTMYAVANQHSIGTVTVENCKLVNIAGLGAGVTDGGGNVTYASRSAAGLGAYPALPSPP